jgi:hypothetical protein
MTERFAVLGFDGDQRSLRLVNGDLVACGFAASGLRDAEARAIRVVLDARHPVIAEIACRGLTPADGLRHPVIGGGTGGERVLSDDRGMGCGMFSFTHRGLSTGEHQKRSDSAVDDGADDHCGFPVPAIARPVRIAVLRSDRAIRSYDRPQCFPAHMGRPFCLGRACDFVCLCFEGKRAGCVEA